MNPYQKSLQERLRSALTLHECLKGEVARQAADALNRIQELRSQVRQEAGKLGYAEACIRSIPDCRGECCKWHYPKDSSVTDLFIALSSITDPELEALQEKLAEEEQRQGCPFLNPDGCIFSFEQRPVSCANAYPCFMTDRYRAFIEIKRKDIRSQYLILTDLFACVFQKSADQLTNRPIRPTDHERKYPLR